MKLRPYQQKIADEVEAEWACCNRNVLVRLDTGGGKTPILAHLIGRHGGFVCAMAHRDKLVEQMSLTLARAGIRHDIIASEKTKRLIARKHVKVFHQSFYVPGARVRVASVQTLVRAKDLAQWAAQVTLWITDEGHHLLRENQWGKATALFTRADCHGLCLTATPGRPDGKGLGRSSDGLMDVMVEGPPMRWLIQEGYLCDYDVVCPPSDLVAGEAPRGADGDYTQAQRLAAEKRSHITGDIPDHYQRWAAGKSGITFVGSIETARDTVLSFRERGVSAELITGETDPDIRDAAFSRAERGELHQIVAVDVISEGVDIPALQVGSFGRLTGSIITWRQQLGRLLRPIYAPGFDMEMRDGRLAAIAASAKPRALLIDHVGGFIDPALGPPDRPVVWTLDRREKRVTGTTDPDDIPRKVCANPVVDCFYPYPRTMRECPKCGYAPEPTSRAAPEFVDGDLQLLTPEALAKLRGEMIDPTLTRGQFDAQQIAKGARSEWLGKHWSHFVADGEAQLALRAVMDLWAGRLHAAGRSDSEIQREFYLRFGVDVLTAGSLKRADADALAARITGMTGQ